MRSPYSRGFAGHVICIASWELEQSQTEQGQTQKSEQTWSGMRMIMMCTCGVSMRTELLYTARSKIAEIRANLDPRRANAAEKTGKKGGRHRDFCPLVAIACDAICRTKTEGRFFSSFEGG